MIQNLRAILLKSDQLLAVLLARLGLCISLAVALIAAPDGTRVAVLMSLGAGAPWAEIDGSCLPMARVLLGGMLVVDGAKTPERQAIFRNAYLLRRGARLMSGCSPPKDAQPKIGSGAFAA